MKNSLKTLLMAGVVSGTALQGSSALAQDNNVALTEQQQITVDLVREYNTCVQVEDTPERAEEIRLYAEAARQAEIDFEQEKSEWDIAIEEYYAERRKILEQHDVGDHKPVYSDYRDLTQSIVQAENFIRDQRIDAIIEQESGLERPEYPRFVHERVQDLGPRPQDAVDICADRISPKFFDAGIDIDWDLDEILQNIIEEHGPDAYEQLVAPETP